jgi:xanthine/uracil/vitamin C permease (AzgA family)
MPASDVVLATAISTGLATATMGLTANYPVSNLSYPISD